MITLDDPLDLPPKPIPLSALFMGFLGIGLRGFGGVLPWARRMIVEERHWLSDAEFTELLSICQILPGPNIANVSVALGARYRGIPGAIACFSGLMTMPLVIVLTLGALYERYGQLPALDPVFHNLGAAAAGLVAATGLKMAAAHWRRPLAVLIAALAFVAVALLQWPLILVVLGLAPLSFILHRQLRQ
ncbi:MAG TPA: chromate transporter [Aliidongia sp.]|nr:chromate transporter [Aliidongia sp.]